MVADPEPPRRVRATMAQLAALLAPSEAARCTVASHELVDSPEGADADRGAMDDSYFMNATCRALVVDLLRAPPPSPG